MLWSVLVQRKEIMKGLSPDLGPFNSLWRAFSGNFYLQLMSQGALLEISAWGHRDGESCPWAQSSLRSYVTFVVGFAALCRRVPWCLNSYMNLHNFGRSMLLKWAEFLGEVILNCHFNKTVLNIFNGTFLANWCKLKFYTTCNITELHHIPVIPDSNYKINIASNCFSNRYKSILLIIFNLSTYLL